MYHAIKESMKELHDIELPNEKQMRKDAVEILKQQLDNNEFSIDLEAEGELDNEIYNDYDEYWNAIENANKWGDNYILRALSKKYNFCYHVYFKNSKKWAVEPLLDNDKCNTGPDNENFIYLFLEGENHYQFLVPTD